MAAFSEIRQPIWVDSSAGSPCFRELMRSIALLVNSSSLLVHRQVHVAVLQDDERVVAAQLKCRVRKVVCGVAGGLDAHLGRAGQSDGVDAGVGAQPVAHRGAAAGHDLRRARCHACLAQELGQAAQGQRVVGGRLHDDGVSRQQCGGDLLVVQVAREVERDHGSDHAQGLATRDEQVVLLPCLHARRDGLAVQVLCPLAERPERDGDVRDLGARLDDGLAGLGAQGLGQRFVVLLDQADELHQDVDLLVHGDGRPGGLGCVCGVDRALDVCLGRRGDRVNELAVCGVGDVDGRAVGGGRWLSVDEHQHKGPLSIPCWLGAT
jgi:hypothetical protein